MEDVDDLTSEIVEDVWKRSIELMETHKSFTTEDGQCVLNGRLAHHLQSYQSYVFIFAQDVVRC